jgi:hypothetical protein
MTDSAELKFGLGQIGQIAVPVRVVDRAIEFYRDVLGMPFLFLAPPGPGSTESFGLSTADGFLRDRCMFPRRLSRVSSFAERRYSGRYHQSRKSGSHTLDICAEQQQREGEARDPSDQFDRNGWVGGLSGPHTMCWRFRPLRGWLSRGSWRTRPHELGQPPA